jgi:hypothetical protein
MRKLGLHQEQKIILDMCVDVISTFLITDQWLQHWLSFWLYIVVNYSLYIYIYIYIYIYVHTHIHKHMCVYIHIYIHAYIHTYIHTCRVGWLCFWRLRLKAVVRTCLSNFHVCMSHVCRWYVCLSHVCPSHVCRWYVCLSLVCLPHLCMSRVRLTSSKLLILAPLVRTATSEKLVKTHFRRLRTATSAESEGNMKCRNIQRMYTCFSACLELPQVPN